MSNNCQQYELLLYELNCVYMYYTDGTYTTRGRILNMNCCYTS